MIVYFLLVPFSRVAGDVRHRWSSTWGCWRWAWRSTARVFAFVGAFFKRPLVIGLVFAFGWEQSCIVLPGYLKQFTVAYYLQALVPHAMPSDGVASLLQGMFRETPPIWVCLAWLFAYLVGFLYLATRVVERKEYILEQ